MPQIIALRDPTFELTGGDRILTTPSTIHLEPCPHHYPPAPHRVTIIPGRLVDAEND